MVFCCVLFFTASEIYQIRKNLRRTVQKYDTQSSGGTASHPSHPISTARAVECVDHSDVSGDSGFCDEFYPVKNGTLPTPTPKPKPRLQMNSDMDYVNCVPPQFCQDLCSSEVLEEGTMDTSRISVIRHKANYYFMGCILHWTQRACLGLVMFVVITR